MVDIHSHFLYGIDDGAKDISQTKKMLDQAIEVGITDLVSTPHFNEFISPNYFENINNVFNEISKYISDNQLNLKIHSGSEILQDPKILDWSEFTDFLIGKNKNYFLFELPHFFEFSKISETIFDLKIKKITPILAHPERSVKIQESPEILIQWINQGCVMQMNAGSILGQFGKKCKATAKRFLDSGVIQLFASDAHEPKRRNYLALKEAKEYIVQNYDEQFANILFVQNPANIIKSKSVKFFVTDSENLKNKKLKYFINKFRITSK
jgi:protein-tyrosine phosphatase